MKFFKTNFVQRLIFYLSILLVAASLAGKSLLSLPFFYHQNAQQKLWIVIIIALSYGILVYFIFRVFILPYLEKFLKLKNVIFIILLFIFLSTSLGINSEYYWAIPEVHTVEICFDANEGSESFTIQKLVELPTNRLYPPDSFGERRYPIDVYSGKCLKGRIVYLTSRLTRSFIVPRMSVFVDEDPPAGRFFISINESPSVVYFNQEEDTQSEYEIIITDGFDQGSQWTHPWKQLWFFGLKAIGIIISAAFLSLFLFGLTEKIVSAEKMDKEQPEGNLS